MTRSNNCFTCTAETNLFYILPIKKSPTALWIAPKESQSGDKVLLVVFTIASES